MSDITIIGLGVSVTDHVTPESERAIRSANEVLYVDTGVATRTWLEARCPVVTDLYGTCYAESGHRLDTYHHIAAQVVEAAMLRPPVVFAVQGHPTVFCYPPFLVKQVAELLGISVSIQPGISSMACLFAELMIDPAPHGLQMYEATDLLLRQRPLLADVPALIWQVGSLESHLFTARPSAPERFVRFRDHLLRYYAPNHPVTAIYASPHPLAASQISHFALGELTEHAAELQGGVTLYVPATHPRPVADTALHAMLSRRGHLDDITR
jgi:hypothetical protein